MGFHQNEVISDLLATATSGQRVEIDGTQIPKAIRFYTGLAAETAAGYEQVDAAANGDMSIVSPHVPPFSALTLTFSNTLARFRGDHPLEIFGNAAKASLLTPNGVGEELTEASGTPLVGVLPVLDGSAALLTKWGSSVGASDVNGLHPAVVFGTAFPNGLITVILTNGNQSFPAGLPTLSSQTKAQFVAKWIVSTTGNGLISQPNMRLNWLALGW